MFAVLTADGTCEAANPAWSRHLGCSPSALTGRDMTEWVDPADRAAWSAALAAIGDAPRDLLCCLRGGDGRRLRCRLTLNRSENRRVFLTARPLQPRGTPEESGADLGPLPADTLRLRGLFNHSADGIIFLTSPDDGRSFTVLRANGTAARLAGRDRDVPQGADAARALPLFGREEVAQALRSVWASQESQRLERVKQPGGTGTRWYRLYVFSLSEREIAVIMSDISLTVMTQDALADNEERYRTIVNTVRDGIFIFKSPEELLFVNEAACRMHGMTRSELLKMAPVDFVHPDSRERFSRMFKALDDNKTYHMDGVGLRGDKSTYEAEIYACPIHCNGETYYYAAAHDVTRQRKAQRALEDGERKFRAYVESSPVPLFIINSRGDVTFANPAAVNLAGNAAPSLFGRPFAELFREFPGDLHAHVRDYAAYRGEAVLGTACPVPVRLEAARLSRKQYMVHCFDLSDSKRLEEEREKTIGDLAQKNREMERVTYTVSHDLRSPLVSIKGFVDMIDDDIRDGHYDELRDSLRYIKQATENMDRFLTQLLELSRVGRMTHERETIQGRVLVDEVLSTLHGLIQEANADIRVKDDLPELYGDVIRLRQIVQNIVENAVKYRDESRPLKVEISGTNSEAGYSGLLICDNGIGIAAEDYDRVFGLFEQVEKRGTSTGIGLAIVKKIIDVHGGRVRVTSEGPGQGACFHVELPIQDIAVSEE